jgi:hypothetical protein
LHVNLQFAARARAALKPETKRASVVELALREREIGVGEDDAEKQ